jgi:hypothetical protein
VGEMRAEIAPLSAEARWLQQVDLLLATRYSLLATCHLPLTYY